MGEERMVWVICALVFLVLVQMWGSWLERRKAEAKHEAEIASLRGEISKTLKRVEQSYSMAAFRSDEYVQQAGYDKEEE